MGQSRWRGVRTAKRRARRFLALCATAIVLLVAPSPESPRIAAQAESDVEGTLELHYEDSHAGARLKYYLDTGTERLALAFARNPPGRLRTGARVRARGARRNGVLMLDTGAAVSPLGGVESGSSTLQLASGNTFGVQSTLVILFNFSDLATEPYTAASAQSVTFNEVNQFYLENSFQQTSLQGTVVGWYNIPAASTTCNYNTWASQAETAALNAGVNLSQYPRRVFGFPQTAACNWWGLGTVGGGTTANPSRAWINGPYTLQVVAHEMGHNLGLFHSRSNACDASGCIVDEYGDDHDVMGGVLGQFNAYQKERLGWLNFGSSPSIQAATGTGQYALEPYATPWGGLPKALRIVKSSAGGVNTYLYAEARTQYGADAALPPGILIHTGADNDGSQIYEEDLLPSAPATDFILDPGQSITFTDAVPQVTLSAISSGSTGATIQVTQGCAYTLGSSGQSFGDAGGSGSVTLTTGSACAWTATSDSGWLTINSGSSTGSGSATIQFTVAANPGGARTGTLTIGGQTFTVTQAAHACVFTVTPVNPLLTHVTGSYTLNVTAAPSTCVWSATSGAPTWLTVTGGSSGTGNGTVTYSVTSNAGSNTARTGTVSVAGVTVNVTQEGLAAIIVSPVNGAPSVHTSMTFQWLAASGAQSYALTVGTTAGGSDLVNTGEITQTSSAVTNLPASRLLYARVRTRFDAATTTQNDISFTTVDRVSSLQLLGAQTPNPIAAGSTAQYGASASNSLKVSFTGSAGNCTATFSATGLPSGATATFSPAAATSSATSQFTLLSVATTAATPPGSYTFNIMGVESTACGGATTTISAPLVVLASTSSLTPAAATGTYGGSTTVSATLTSGGTPVSGKTVSFTVNGIAVGSATTAANGIATLANASLTGIAAGSYPAGVGASFAGDASFGAASGTGVLTVSQKSVAPAVTAANKVYDATPGATLTSCTLTGVIGGEVVGCTGAATFASANVGTTRLVTVTGMTLTGASAANYTLATATATTTANITARPVTPAVTVADKVFDGTTSATLTSCTLTGVIAGEVVGCTGTATFASATVGAGKTVTVTGLTLTGTSAANYALTTTTATTTANITGTSGPRPVAAYAFNEGTGSTATDASGTGNTGSITGATWTAAGRYGGALSFNGSTALVTIPDAPSLHVTTALTVEAWVNPSTSTGFWEDVIYKGNDTFYLDVASGAEPVVGGTWASENLTGPAPLVMHTWTHLAATYDGATIRLYVNGTLVGSAAQTGVLAASTHPLQIGGDSLYGQYFAGLIDDVRVYTVALTAAQIQADMNTPIAP